MLSARAASPRDSARLRSNLAFAASALARSVALIVAAICDSLESA